MVPNSEVDITDKLSYIGTRLFNDKADKDAVLNTSTPSLLGRGIACHDSGHMPG